MTTDQVPGIGDPRLSPQVDEIDRLFHELRGGWSSQTRIKAAEKLGELHDSRAIGPLLGRLTNDRETEVRIAAAIALYQIGNAQAWPVFISRLSSIVKDEQEPEAVVRAKLAELLGFIENREYALPLTEALKDPDKSVREAVAVALGSIKSLDVIPQLISGLVSESKSSYYNIQE